MFALRAARRGRAWTPELAVTLFNSMRILAADPAYEGYTFADAAKHDWIMAEMGDPAEEEIDPNLTLARGEIQPLKGLLSGLFPHDAGLRDTGRTESQSKGPG